MVKHMDEAAAGARGRFLELDLERRERGGNGSRVGEDV